MTAQELVDRALAQSLTPERIVKLKAKCAQFNVRYDDVIALLPEEKRPHAREE